MFINETGVLANCSRMGQSTQALPSFSPALSKMLMIIDMSGTDFCADIDNEIVTDRNGLKIVCTPPPPPGTTEVVQASSDIVQETSTPPTTISAPISTPGENLEGKWPSGSVSTDSIIHTQHQDMGAEHAKSSVTAAHVTALPYLAHYNAESGPLIHRAINTILLCAALVTLTVLASFFFLLM
jgi:hypothetical protein